MSQGQMINATMLFGHRSMREMPMIFVGRMFGVPFEHVDYDGAGNERSRYYSAPMIWLTLAPATASMQ